MNETDQPIPTPVPAKNGWVRTAVFLILCLIGAGGLLGALLRSDPVPAPKHFNAARYEKPDFQDVVKQVDAEFEENWRKAGVEPAPLASAMTLTRRLSLALTGTVPSLEEIRAVEQLPSEEVTQWWLSKTFEDRRYSDYLAERFARVYVGIEKGPFLVYRRHRMVDWLGDQIAANRHYNDLVRELISANGIWTTEPEVNFITATIDQNNKKKGPDEVKLAARVTRAFLGVRLDCVQCHDDFMGGDWQQKDFHQLAAFFAPAEMSLTGVRDNKKKKYEFRYHGSNKEELVSPQVPFQRELLPQNGAPRERLARWVTSPENHAFARTTVNRVWALLFNRPMTETIDKIPLEGPYPAGMELLANDLIAHDFDLQRLIRVIAATRAFRADSAAADGNQHVTDAQEKLYAAFPLTRLRPEQVAGSVIQAASLETIDAQSHIIYQLVRYQQMDNFVKRYGDMGEDEFNQGSGTIPQRLLLMNGNLVKERTKENPVMNASSRISMLAPDDKTAVETAYLCILTRLPSREEMTYFTEQLTGKKKTARNRVLEDLYWTLMNATEFSWNH